MSRHPPSAAKFATMKFACTLLNAGIVDTVAPSRTVVRYGKRSQLLNAPWSLDSRHVLNRRLFTISFAPPNPSLKLIAALGILKTILFAMSACAVSAWK